MYGKDGQDEERNVIPLTMFISLTCPSLFSMDGRRYEKGTASGEAVPGSIITKPELFSFQEP